jgi:hypothetical protein
LTARRGIGRNAGIDKKGSVSVEPGQKKLKNVAGFPDFKPAWEVP